MRLEIDINPDRLLRQIQTAPVDDAPPDRRRLGSNLVSTFQLTQVYDPSPDRIESKGDTRGFDVDYTNADSHRQVDAAEARPAGSAFADGWYRAAQSDRQRYPKISPHSTGESLSTVAPGDFGTITSP